MNGVSILITAYNAQNFIEECLDSIERQTHFKKYDNWEVIVGVDGCIKTLEKLNSIKHNYRNLKVIMMSSNKGTYITSNTLINLANPNYQYNLRFDADDVMLSNSIELLLKSIGDNDFLKFRHIDYDTFELSQYIVFGIVFYKKSILNTIGGYLPLRCGCDTDFMNRVTKSNLNVITIKSPIFRRRKHSESLTRAKETNFVSEYRELCRKYFIEMSKHKIIYVEKQTNNYFNLIEIQEYFYKQHDYELKLTEPKTFNEKMWWRKFFQHDQIISRLTDKINVKYYASELIGDDINIPYQVIESFDDIKFDEIKKDVVIKVNHGCGWHFFFKGGKLLDSNYNEVSYVFVKNQINTWLNSKFAQENNHRYAWGYQDIQPKLYLEDFIGDNVMDYKFHSFNGKTELIQVDENRNIDQHMSLFDSKWKCKDKDLKWAKYDSIPKCKKPKELNKLLEYVSILSKGIDYCRVDFLYNGKKFYINEITFYHSGGQRKITPLDWDLKLGELWKLNTTIPIENKNVISFEAPFKDEPINNELKKVEIREKKCTIIKK